MKRIEDAPKELKDMFDLTWKTFCETETNRFPYQVCGDFFVKGFDTAMATAGMPRRAKRIISHLIELDGQIYAISNDGRLFTNHYQRPNVWISYPDLPQD